MNSVYLNDLWKFESDQKTKITKSTVYEKNYSSNWFSRVPAYFWF